MRVLIVEDDPPLRHTIARALTAHGFEIAEAASRDEALTSIAQARPDVLLLDVHLPDGTGWDVLRALRELNQRIPVVIIAGLPASASRLREFQPIGVLHKPFPLDALIRLVSKVSNEQQNSETKEPVPLGS